MKSIYKGKGSKTDSDNYRGIAILSCLGKLFTSILEKRLSYFLDHFNINSPEQAGFKSGFSAEDHMHALKILIDLFLFNNKRLYMCFVDYKKAFDNVNRIQLWQKMIDYNINGKIFNVVHNMYNQAKSCVSLPDGSVSSMFQCEVGVRQGENLSPLLFSIYLSDLNTFLANKNYGLKQFQSLASEFLNDDRILIFLKLHVLLYADNTVLIAETPENLQKTTRYYGRVL